jgi:uncharacterized protein
LYPSEYIQFLAHFHGDRDYFECHELLEDYWKKTDLQTKDSIWVAYILLAVSVYHHRRSNFSGAKRTLVKAVNIFKLQEGSLTKLGIDKVSLFQLLTGRIAALQQGESYKSFSLPISDPILLELAKKACDQQGVIWGNESDMSNHSIVHRHKLRDRTSVIEERKKALETRKSSE